MKLKITVTKDIYRKSMMCGIGVLSPETSPNKNCAIALATRDIFPKAEVHLTQILLLDSPFSTIILPNEAIKMIEEFDRLGRVNPSWRLEMDEFSFEIEVPQSVIDSIDISEVSEALINHPNLELIF